MDMKRARPAIIVSGLARSGTSVTMQMLKAAGLKLYWNRLPNETPINPHGHFELTKATLNDVEEFRRNAPGRVVKVFPKYWPTLLAPTDRMIYLDRDPASIYESQKVMFRMENREEDGVRVTVGTTESNREYALSSLPCRHIVIQYEDIFTGRAQEQIAKFLHLDRTAANLMKTVVDPTLHHFKEKRNV